MRKRWPLVLTLTGVLLSVVAFYLLFIVYRQAHTSLTVPFLMFSLITTFTAPALGAFRLTDERRKKIERRLLIIALVLIVNGCLFTYLHLITARGQVIFGVLLFTFTYGTLALKNKYDKWKLYTRSGWQAFLFSLLDFFGTGLLFLGALFWFQHWPLYTALLSCGALLLAVGTFAWNHTFRKEVVYRKNAEDQLQIQKLRLEEKQKEITDSIIYAKRIQHSLLAHDEYLQRMLKEHFVFYLPKDIVSGDFYWCTETSDSFYLAVCDSTGHGVPGAFMSLLNISFLNEAITEKKIAEPHLIFEHARRQLIANISQEGAQDGMDGILVRIEKRTAEVSYAAANSGPVIVRGGEAIECASDKMPVGKGERMDPFNLYKAEVQKGDMLYLCTDGFSDQFGGARGKKLKRTGLKEHMKNYGSLPMAEQRRSFETAFLSWKGSLEQIDDVCLIGIRIQ